SKFEEIEAWQLAREMCRLVKHLTEKEKFSQDWELKKQIKASSGSAMDCIAEGYERGNKNEFVFFLGIAKGSTGEVRSQAYRALDWGYITEEERKELDKLAWRTGAALQKLIQYLNATPKGGQRFAKIDKDKSIPAVYSFNPDFPTEPPPYLQ
ncbi:MAG: four helix bundle protein, partial [Thermoanaerobaculia bacterium]|nr:four helix bundle protein [Thermoanaerobaculia bacterium]